MNNSCRASERRITATACAGFTLIELLVAMAITVVIAIVAYRFLDSALSTSASSEDLLREANELEKFWQVLAADLQYASSEQLPQAELADDRAPAFSGGSTDAAFASALSGTPLLRLLRDGWSNPLQQQRSDLQRVAYRWHEGQVLRDYWPERNQPQVFETPRQQLLLGNVRDIQIRFLPPDAANMEDYWLYTWPLPAVAASDGETVPAPVLPAAVEINLTLEGLGDVRRLFPLPGI